MDSIIDNAEDISLNEEDLKLICHPIDIKIILYQELHQLQDINELFELSDNIIILYRTTQDYGHFVSLLNYDTHIEYFDSYGEAPDYELKFSEQSLRHMKGHIIPHISSLLKIASERDKKKIIYNKIKLQRYHEHVNTCGRWAALRIKFRHLDLKRFQKLFLKQSNPPDNIVTYLTYLLVDKDIKELV